MVQEKGLKQNVRKRLALLRLKKIFFLISSDTYKEKRAIILFENSNLFDREWYLKQYPVARIARMTPERHYYLMGWKIGLNPSPRFDGNAYLNDHADVKAAEINPLEHYLLFGQNDNPDGVLGNGNK